MSREFLGGFVCWFGNVGPTVITGTPPATENYFKIQRRLFAGCPDSGDGWQDQDIASVLQPSYNFSNSDRRKGTIGRRDGSGVFWEYTGVSYQFQSGYQYRLVPNRAASGDDALRTLRCSTLPGVAVGDPLFRWCPVTHSS